MATREELRQSVGSNLGGLLATRGQIVSDSQISYEGPGIAEMNGYLVWYNGEVREVQRADQSSARLTLNRPLDNTVTGDDIEIWTSRWSPAAVNGFINQAILDARRSFYTLRPSRYECITERNRVVQLSADAVMDVYYRKRWEYLQVYSYQLWTDAELDYRDYRYSPSQRIALENAAGTVTSDVDVGGVNLSGMTHVEGWIKQSGPLTSIEWDFREVDTVLGTVTLNGIEADTWTYFRLPLPSPVDLALVDNLQARMEKRAGAGHVWLNGMWGVNYDSIDWQPLDRSRWEIELETSRLVVRPMSQSVRSFLYRGGINPVGNVIRIDTGSDPVALDSDSDNTEVHFEYIVAYATELGFSRVSGGRQTDPDNFRQQIALWGARRQQAQANFPILMNVRRIRG